MRTIVFSDSHISKDSNNLKQVSKLCNIITYNKPDLVVMNGDICDPWVSKWTDIIQLPEYAAIEDMCYYRAKHNLPTKYIKGNHDWLIPSFVFPNTEKLVKYELIDPNNMYPAYKYIFTHGHQFDIIWGGGSTFGFVHDIAFFIQEKTPWLMMPIYNLLFKHKVPSAKKAAISGAKRLVEQQNDQGALDEALNDWSLHFATIQLRVAKYAKAKKARVFTGHTHAPTAFNGLMSDCGDLLDSNTYLDIVDKVVSLKKL